jgi:hypothetical protein
MPFSAYLGPMQGGTDRQSILWKRLEILLLLTLLATALWPVWGNVYFLTNDGPCHLYNARILRDMLLGHNTAYFGEWFSLNPNIEPNWLNHFLLAGFQLVLPPIVSEKLFLTLYILGFAWSFRYLARSVYPANDALIFLAMPFIFHKVFLMGFFNFSASVVLFFWVIGYWLRHRADRGWRARAGLGLRLLLLLVAHPVSYCMALGLAGLHWLGECTAALGAADRKQKLATQLRVALGAVIAGLPSLVLLAAFMVRQGTNSVPSQMKLHKLFHDFLEIKSLVLFQDVEKPWPIVLSLLIALLMVVGFFRLRKRAAIHEGILAMLALSVYAYFTQPAQVGGVGIVPERLQFYPYLIALCWLVTLPWPRWLLRGVTVMGFALTMALFALRLPSYAVTSEAVEEFVSAQNHMRPYTSAVMLSYAPEGRLPHNTATLSKEAYIFMHVTEYIGAQQPHIIFNNYEGNTKWFPLRWNAKLDPYVHLASGPGFEGWLPTADFEKFRRETGKDVDYVLQWCLAPGMEQYDGVQLMQTRLEKDYQLTYISEGERLRLWERKH